MENRLYRLIAEPIRIRTGLTWEELWSGADGGLIRCWERAPRKDARATMTNEWARQAVYHKNEFKQSAGQLIGIAAGLIADKILNDAEIHFLHDWIAAHDEIAYDWPGDIVFSRVKAVLADGMITEEERTYLLRTLQDLVGESPAAVANATHVTELAFDDFPLIDFPGFPFCLTGNFVYAPREVCEAVVLERGGIIKSFVSRKLRYLVVGSLGSPEWKHGGFGTKIEKAMEFKRAGAPIQIVREDAWAAAL
jgi:hypothetical protein